MHCPICKNDYHDKIYRLCDNMRILGESFPEEEVLIVSCKNCGLVYLSTQASQDDYINYYKYNANAPKYYEMFGKDGTDDYYDHIFSILKPYISVESSLLDIAGAWGELAEFLREKGFSNITVVDPNESCIRTAKEKGFLTSISTSVNMVEDLKESYDLIILNHTLEHIIDVEKTMKNIDALLKDDGLLYIEVPNAASYINEESAPFNFLTYEHVLHLTENDLRNIANLYGYEICKIDEYYKKVSNYPSIYAVLKKNNSKRNIMYSSIGRKNVTEYIEKSKLDIDEFINPLRESGESIILWGIGASTASLIGLFSGCNVKGLIDSNTKRQGLAFSIDGKNYKIKGPEIVGEGTIVILSIPYYDSIEKQIRNMGLSNKIISLGR